MKKITSFSFLVLALVVMLNINLRSQQCEVTATNIIFESANSLTFDVYFKNTGASSFPYSHGSVAWYYNTAFLNGGTPTFSLVPGFSEFPAGAHPPSALITNPNILRTSSNMPGSNGVILPGENLLFYRFRLQTSAVSFTSNYFNLTWKNDITPFTRIYSWDSGTGLPMEIGGLNLSVAQLFLDENFSYGAVGNPDLLAVTTNWTRHSGTAGPVYSPTSLNYTSYPSSGIGGSVNFTNGGSGVNDGDVNRVFPDSVTTTSNVYAAFLLELDSARATADYFFHFGQKTIATTFRGKVFAKSFSSGWVIGLSKSENTGTLDTLHTLNFNQTYLLVVKYSFNPAAANDDLVTLYLYDSGIPATEPGSPLVTIGPVGSGVASDPSNIGSVAIRQGTNTPGGTIDGIRVATTWSEIFLTAAGSTLNATPPSLSGFSYLSGGGPSASQNYNLSGSDLVPASGNITVTGSTNYEVSINNSTFSGSVNVPYTGGTLNSTLIYVRLKSGLVGGVYNGEIISNAGGGATTVNVICDGTVLKSEPTNHATSFSGVNGSPSYYYINLSWTDASGGTLPDGYLIKGSALGFDSISVPVDSMPESNSTFVQNVVQGDEAVTFGLNSGTTYYFKIYPYSNSGLSINYKTDGSVPQFNLSTTAAPSLALVENFEYTTGSNLTANGWVAHSGTGTNPIQVNAAPLNYSGYFSSGVGKSVSLTNTGEDANRAFDSVASGSIYASFMVNITSANLAGDYFFHFAPENSTTGFYAKVFVRKDASDNLAFGLAKNLNTDSVCTPFNYSLNTTYLIVVKYTYNSGTTDDDEVKLWINPVLNGTEPSSDLTQTDGASDALSLGMFALRQGTASNAAELILGGIRVAETWIPGSSSTFNLTVSVANSWNMVSAPGLHPVNQNVTTWWTGKDPAANVFKYSGGYSAVTTTTPTQGYWMKNVGAQTYVHNGVIIVSHDPIAGAVGWNLIGGYDYNALTSGITTVPAGQVQGSVFGYAGGYFAEDTLKPGYGYWIKLGSAAQIVLPSSSFKGVSKIVNNINEDWGKIIITDAAGKGYTLYAVNGKSNLNDYELPPVPPAGMFDVRYASGRFAEELSSGQLIELSGIVYPAKVRTENMNIRIQDETGSEINELLKSGEELLINSSLITKLLVSGEIIPDEYSLEQNYPNPFNPTTQIRYSIPNAGLVTLKVYNTIGEEIATLVNEQQEAGRYTFEFNSNGFASGVYLYKITSGDFTQTKKMILIK